MSAFFLAINRDQTPFSRDLADTIMSTIEHFGHDAATLHVVDHFALGYQSHWTVPEEINEHQPIFNHDTDQWFMFHGRLDNRSDLFAAFDHSLSSDCSDATLAHAFFAEYGADRLSDLIGPFVFVVFDVAQNTVMAARDGLGGRYLCYSITDEIIVIATYELALVASGAVAYNLNDEKAARILMNEMEDRPSSTIAGVSPLLPGELVSVGKEGVDAIRFYAARPARRVTLPSNEAYGAEFKRLLAQAVKRRLRSVGPVGTMLSGGLDSVPMTILAAQESPTRITAFSWVFDDYPALDERVYSSPVCAEFGIDQVCIPCDRVWPQFDDDTHVNPVFPFGIPYSEFQQETFRHARSAGVKVLLTGIHGDLLYEQHDGVLYELLGAGRWRDAVAEFRRLWRAVPEKWQLIKYYLLKPLSYVTWFSERRTMNQEYPSDCLQENIASLLVRRPHWLKQEARSALRPKQWQVVLDGFSGEDAAHGRYMEAKYAIERRYPYRDRDLCEFMLAIPSDQLYFNLTKRPIVKSAFSEELGEALKSRNDKTNFNAIIDDGIRRDKANLEWFKSEPHHWNHYVKQCYFEEKQSDGIASDVIKWRCGYYQYWKSVCYNPLYCKLGQNQKNEKRYEKIELSKS